MHHKHHKNRWERREWARILFSYVELDPVAKLDSPKTVGDWGCGYGYFLHEAERRWGACCYGFDMDYIDLAAYDGPRGSFWPCDLEKESPKPFKCDLAVSLETAEHLTQAGGDRMITSIVSCEPTWIIWSAAIPGQRGRGHINCQLQSHWSKQFTDRGYIPIKIPALRDDTILPKHLRRNVLVYVPASNLNEA